MSSEFEFDEEFPQPLVEEKEKKKRKKPFKGIITIKDTSDKFIEKLRSMKFLQNSGICDITINVAGHISRDRKEGVYMEAVELGLQYKRENPNSIVKVVIIK